MVNSLINTIFWVSTTLLVATYIFPLMGMNSRFGAFIAITTIGSVSYFQCFGTIATFLADLTGDRIINFQLALPIPSWVPLVAHAISYFIRVSILSLVILPLAKILLWNRLDLSQWSIPKSIIVFISIHLFSGFFGLFLISSIKSMDEIMDAWNRALFPMWFFGGAQFSWLTLNSLVPSLSYVTLANPFLYGMEGLHSAFLGREGFLPFWICVGALWIMTIGFGSLGIIILKKRLDCI